jgi:carboxyl-terminal processing protease
LTIQHQGETQSVTIEVVRDEIRTASVFSRMQEGDIGYLNIAFISSRTDEEVRDHLRDLQRAGAKKLILDLRRNPGGLLQETISVASNFVQGTILLEVNRQGRERPYEASSGGLALNTPLAVLVDQTSASGAEVIAGAIQDAGRGPLIGDRTFGKGSVNNVRELSDGSALYVTVARWLTPKRRAIEGVGLSPDIHIPIDPEEILVDDPVLARAITHLQGTTSTSWALPQWLPTWPKTSLTAPVTTWLRDLLEPVSVRQT